MKNVSRTIMTTDNALSRGLDFAFVTLLFLGLGFLVDRWLGTTPVFMIILVVVALVGLFARIWFGYEASMQQLEAERANAGRSSHGDRARVAQPATGEGVGA